TRRVVTRSSLAGGAAVAPATTTAASDRVRVPPSRQWRNCRSIRLRRPRTSLSNDACSCSAIGRLPWKRNKVSGRESRAWGRGDDGSIGVLLPVAPAAHEGLSALTRAAAVFAAAVPGKSLITRR